MTAPTELTARTVIGFNPAGTAVWMTLDRAPLEYESDSAKIDLARLTGTTLVERGTAIAKLLARRDPVKAILAAAFALPPGATPYPLYFHVRAAAADAVQWEQLYAPRHGFCALDPRWPVGRIAEIVRTVRARAFEPPLRLVAVLAAAGRSGVPQLKAILEAVAAAPLQVRLHVITSDEDLLAEAAAAGDGVTSELIKGTSAELRAQITAAKPHVLHLLCHGDEVAGVRTLRFATLADVDAERTDFGSLSVTATELVTALNTCDPWLVVLSACQTAHTDGSTRRRALAHELVSAGITAVIGMRRLVDLTEMNRFCKALYPEVLASIAKVVSPVEAGQSAQERILDWASVLTNPRKVMSGEDPTVADTWLDPVLYVQNDDLRVLPPSQQMAARDYAKLQGRLDQYLEFLGKLDLASADPAMVNEVRGRIADVQSAFEAAGVLRADGSG